VFCRGLRTADDTGQTRFLLSLFFPLFLLYFFLSFQKASQANWPAAAYVGGFIFLAAEMGCVDGAGPLGEVGWDRQFSGRDDRDIRLTGNKMVKPASWEGSARSSPGSPRFWLPQVFRLRTETGAESSNRQRLYDRVVALVYLPGQPDTYMPLSSAPYNQLILWPTYREVHPQEDAIFIRKRIGFPIVERRFSDH